MNEAHQAMLQRLAQDGRLGDYCPWPKPHAAHPRPGCIYASTFTEERCPSCFGLRNWLHPQVVVTDADGGRRVMAPAAAVQIRDHPSRPGYVPGHERTV